MPGDDLESMADNYFASKRDTVKDLERFVASMANRPPMVVRSALSAVRGFLVENNTEVGESGWRRALTPRISALDWPLCIDMDTSSESDSG